jgi:phosphoribosylaminoimidazole-succinocarboxamide synthase
MLVRRAQVIPVECVARGYLSGSGWVQYRASTSVCGVPLPDGLVESDRLPAPIFTPTTKAAEGHDLPLTFDETVGLVGRGLAERLRELTITIYERIADVALASGIIVADTKFEFGLVGEGHPARDVVLIDEVLTPDSSRFWPQRVYEPGHGQPSFDKQYVRDYLEEIRWNKQPPVPSLPDEVIRRTRDKYIEAFRLLTGRELQ